MTGLVMRGFPDERAKRAENRHSRLGGHAGAERQRGAGMSAESAGFDDDQVVSGAVVSDAIVGEGYVGSDGAPDNSVEPDDSDVGQQPVLTEWTATSRTGSITVRTTEQGLPLGVSVDAAELKRDPRALA